MRELVIAIAVAGCGGGRGTTSNGPPLTADQIARACAGGYACVAPPIDGPTTPNCLRRLDDIDTLVSQYRPEQIRCLAAAGANCTTARACLGYSFGPCSPLGTHCEGDQIVDCDRDGGLRLDCSGGLWWTDDTTCVDTGQRIDCGIATCTQGTPGRCDGTRAVMCGSDDILQEIDCAQLDATCVVDGTRAGCAGAGPACTASHCDGDRLVRCAGGREWAVDCAKMFAGGTCMPGGRDGFSCGFGPSCGDTATCDGNTSRLCVLGVQIAVDCIAAGFAGCALGSCIPATFP